MPALEEELKNMDEALRRLKIEYHIFFNGGRKKPPEDLKLRLERQVKQLSERSDMTHAQRFQYTTLVTRYYTYRNLWRRTLQKQEKGIETKKEVLSQSGKSPDTKASTEKFRVSLSDPETEQNKVQSLYDALQQKKTENSEESPISYQQFTKFIASQTHNIRDRYGSAHVTYSISLEGGVIRVTATAGKS